MSDPDEVWMREALKEAQRASDENEVPVGAVVVYRNKLIAKAHNQIKRLKDPTAHAEMIALTSAANFLQNERLLNASIYVTIEPCAMCAGAIILGRLKRLVFGAPDPKTGACGSVTDLLSNERLNHHVQLEKGVLEKECSLLLREFFKAKRISP